MRNKDFHADAPGHLTSTIKGVQAFVPNPIPQGLQLDIKTVTLLAEADNALGKLAGTTSREFNPYLVGSPLLHREAIASSRIEGTITTPERLVLLEATAGRVGAKPVDEDTQEVQNYIRAMHYGLDQLKTMPVCLRVIQGMHHVLLESVRGEKERPGEFRDAQNWVRGRVDDEIAHARFVPPPVSEMKSALYELETYLNREGLPDPLLVQLALIHYQFEAIHPFRDGNGRIGRLLLPLLLCSRGRLEIPVLYLSTFFEQHRDLYVDLLLSVSQVGNWNSWIKFFLLGVKESAIEATTQAMALLDLRRNYHRMFQKGRSSALLIRLIDALFESPSTTIQGTALLLDVSQQAAASNIRKLEKAGILEEVTGRQRGQVFLAKEIIKFMYVAKADGDQNVESAR